MRARGFGPPSLTMRVASWLFQAGHRWCPWLGDVESAVLGDALGSVAVREPVFIAGVARSGSTMLLEALASLPGMVSTRYCDYPPIWIPFWWERIRQRLPLPKVAPQIRAHGDRIAVTPLSPEAFDEVLWMHFFPGRHDPHVDQRLDERTSNPAFEQFYPRHIRKILLARGANRYVCKGNYNLLRIAYLHRLFPDARFVVPIRAPVAHVRSLVKQHHRFCALAKQWPSVGRQLGRRGHFEFGPQRQAEDAGDDGNALRAAFDAGNDVEGFARQWAVSYGALAALLDRHSALAEQVLLVPFEQICAEPAAQLERLADHCRVAPDLRLDWIEQWASRFRAPESASMASTDESLINSICGSVAQRLGLDGVPKS